jgi:hypothetical protein
MDRSISKLDAFVKTLSRAANVTVKFSWLFPMWRSRRDLRQMASYSTDPKCQFGLKGETVG